MRTKLTLFTIPPKKIFHHQIKKTLYVYTHNEDTFQDPLGKLLCPGVSPHNPLGLRVLQRLLKLKLQLWLEKL